MPEKKMPKILTIEDSAFERKVIVNMPNKAGGI